MATLIKAPSLYPFIAWERLKPAITWRQGQHALTVGGTDSGKSTVAGEFLPRREKVVVLVSKGKDPIFDGPYYKDFLRIGAYPPPRPLPWQDKRRGWKSLLWPAVGASSPETKAIKFRTFAEAMDRILLRDGNVCVVIDETHYTSKLSGPMMIDGVRKMVSLSGHIEDLVEQGRSHGISVWNNTQRPSGISLSIYSCSHHAFLFTCQEQYDLERLRLILNKHTNPKELEFNLQKVDSYATHEFIYIDRTGKIPPCRSIVQRRH
jgi:hypothetical protein